MKDLLFLMEPSTNEWITPLKIGNLYLNRLIVDEEAAFEVLGIHNFAPSRYEVSVDKVATSEFCKPVESELREKGMEFQALKLEWLRSVFSTRFTITRKKDDATVNR